MSSASAADSPDATISSVSTDSLDGETCYAACQALDTLYTVVGIAGDVCNCYKVVADVGAPASDPSACDMACPGNAAETCSSSTADADGTLHSVYAETRSMRLHPAGSAGAGDSWAITGINQCGATLFGSTVEFFNMIADGLLVANGSTNTDIADLTYRFDDCSSTVSSHPDLERQLMRGYSDAFVIAVPIRLLPRCNAHPRRPGVVLFEGAVYHG